MKHGLAQKGKVHPVYKIWCSMIARCYNPKHTVFKHYGGRGIRLCKRWLNSSHFIKDMLPSWEKGLSIHRKNNDGNYSRSNCVWVTREIQSNNKRNNRRIRFKGVDRTIGEWSRITGIKWGTLDVRIRVLKWPIKKVLETPTRGHKVYEYDAH